MFNKTVTAAKRFRWLMFVAGVFVSCQGKPYAPPPRPATVDTLEVRVSRFGGRPEAWATVSGRLTTSAAQLVDTRQSRDGRRLRLEILEQTPRGANLTADLVESPRFEKRIPLELIGLAPGVYIVSANGVEASLEIPEDPAMLPERKPTLSDRVVESSDADFVDLEEYERLSPETPGFDD